MSLGNTLQKRKGFVPPAIQITSMMDMFTIIVFFLLFSYSDNPDEFDLSANLALPTSTSTINYDHAIALFLTENSIKLEEETIGKISGENVVNLDVNDIAGSDVAKAFAATKAQLSSELDVPLDQTASPTDEILDPSDPHILLFCDQNVPFKAINQVIKAAGSAGFTNFQLAVMEQ
jgi:biopolymer transport protein ExbD